MTSLQVQYFLYLAEYKNFTVTADSLHITQPVISKQIASLERELGFPLFERSHHQIQLTQAGEIMYSFFSKSMDEYDTARTSALQSYSCFSSSISFWMLQFYDNARVDTFISESYRRHPNISLYIERQFLPCTRDQLRQNQWDIAITFQDLATGMNGYTFFELEKTYDLLLISMNHPLAQKQDLCVEDFSNETFCHTGKVKWDTTGRFDQSSRIESYNLGQCRMISVSNMSSVISTVATGAAFAIVESSVLPFIKFPYRFIRLSRQNSIGLVYQTKCSNPFVNNFISEMLDYLKSGS